MSYRSVISKLTTASSLALTSLLFQACAVNVHFDKTAAVSLNSASSSGVQTHQLVFTTQPSNIVAGAVIRPSIQVSVEDPSGTVITTDHSTITLSFYSNTGGGNILGTVIQAAINGVATFNDISVDKVANGYAFLASDASAKPAASGFFDVSAGAAAKLAFLAQPTNTAMQTAINPSVSVEVQDAYGNPVISNASITLGILSSPSNGVLNGTLKQNAVGGIAIFPGINIDLVGNGYTLGATSGFLTGAISTAFNVTSSGLFDEFSLLSFASFSPMQSTADAFGNLYVVGEGQDYNFTSHWIVMKRSGGIWSKIDDYTYSNSSTLTSPYAVTADNLGNVYVAGAGGWDGNADRHWIVRKFDGNSWTTIDDYLYSNAWGSDSIAYAIAADSSGNLFAAGMGTSFGVQAHWIVRKYSVGAWSTIDDYQYSGGSASYPEALSLDGSGNLFAAGQGVSGANTHWIVREYSNGSWSALDDYQHAGATSAVPFSVQTHGTDLYVSGQYTDTSNHQLIRKYSAGIWSTIDDYQYVVGKSTVSPAMTFDSSGNLYAAGSAIDNLGQSHALTRKYSAGIWTILDSYQYSAGFNSSAASIAQVVPNVLDICIQAVDGASHSHWVTRTLNIGALSTTGDEQFSLGNVQAKGVVSDLNGNLYSASYSMATILGVTTWIVRKFSAGSWTTIDSYQLVANQSSRPSALATDLAGNIYVAGYGTDAAAHQHWIVRKYNGLVWTTIDDYVLASGFDSNAQGIATDSTGKVFAVGFGNDGSSVSHWIVREYSAAIWSTIDDFNLAAGVYSAAYATTVNTDGSVYVSGVGTSSWLIRQYSNGAWTTVDNYAYPGGTNSQIPTAITHDSFGDIYTAGYALDGSYFYHWIVRKFDGSSWSTVDDYQLAGSQHSEALAITVNTAGSVYIAGYGTDASSILHWIVREYSGGNATVQDYQLNSTNNAQANGITWDNTLGKIVVTGTAGTIAGTNYLVTQTAP